MLRSEGLSCEMPVNNSFPPYSDFRRTVFSNSGENFQSTGNGQYHGLGENVSRYDCTFSQPEDGELQDNNVVYEQLSSGDTDLLPTHARDLGVEDAANTGRDDMLSCRKQNNAGKEEQMIFPPCRKYPLFPPPPPQYSSGIQTYSGQDYGKPTYTGGGALYPSSFQRQSHAYPVAMYGPEFHMGHGYYHGGQISPALGHSPPGVMGMGGPGGHGFYPHNSVCVYLCNRDLWSKFHQHTCEMIITKQGR